MEKNAGYAVGIDLGGTFIKYALVSDEGKIIFQNKVALGNDISREVILEKIYQSVNKTLDEAARRSIEVSGIGVGSPGIVYNGVIIGGADNLNGWENIELKSFLENKFHLMTQVENDANVMGLGEVFYGAARGCSDVVFLTIGTGIGGAMVLNGKLYGGYQNRGGELGHITIAYNGIDCNCGGRGCLEAYASTSALIKQYTKAMEISDDGIDGRYIVKKYLAKESYNQWDYETKSWSNSQVMIDTFLYNSKYSERAN